MQDCIKWSTLDVSRAIRMVRGGMTNHANLMQQLKKIINHNFMPNKGNSSTKLKKLRNRCRPNVSKDGRIGNHLSRTRTED